MQDDQSPSFDPESAASAHQPLQTKNLNSRQEAALEAYRELGWKPVPLTGKAPFSKDWQNKTFTDSEFEGRNVGVTFGEQWVDFDFDYNAAAQIANNVYAGFRTFTGRLGRVHVIVKVENGTGKFETFPHGEYRTGKNHQTMMPPSIHPDTGALVQWNNAERFYSYPDHATALAEYKAIGVASYLIEQLEQEGCRDVLTIALANICKRVGLDEDSARAIVTATSEVAGDTTDRKRGDKVSRVYNKQGGRFYGLPEIQKHVSEESFQNIEKILRGDHSWPDIDVGDFFATSMDSTFPMDFFPDPVAKYLSEVAMNLRQPDGAAGVLGMAAFCLAAGNIRVQVRRSWEEPLCLWAQVVADQGFAKSALLRAVSLGIRAWEREQAIVYQELLATWKATPSDERGEPPSRRFVIVDDATVESVVRELDIDTVGHGALIDELTGLHRNMGRYSQGRGNDKEFLLTAWSGDAYSKTRVGTSAEQREGSNRIFLVETYHALLGTTTRASLIDVISQVDADNGFLVRFLNWVIPRGYDRQRAPGFDLDSEAEAQFTALQQAFCELRTRDVHLQMSEAAWNRFSEYNQLCTDRGRYLGAIDSPLAGYVTKYPRQVARIAGLWALLRFPMRQSGLDGYELAIPPAGLVTIDTDAVEAAIQVVQALEVQVKNLHGVTSTTDIERVVSRLAVWMAEHDVERFQPSTLVHKIKVFGRDSKHRKAELEQFCFDLVEMGFASYIEKGKGGFAGTSRRSFQLHPSLLDWAKKRLEENPEERDRTEVRSL